MKNSNVVMIHRNKETLYLMTHLVRLIMILRMTIPIMKETILMIKARINQAKNKNNKGIFHIVYYNSFASLTNKNNYPKIVQE